MTDVVWPAEPEYHGERLHQPWRLAVALVELLLTGGALWAAFACWGNAVSTVTVRLDDGTELVSRQLSGDWVTGAVALGAVAGFLVLDAVRQLLLGVRARRRRYRKSRERRENSQLAHT
ncbi:hypothetical protein [Qaidamihabitans albus]|uniref:hypothetical protein n=1 Tax=Qaidamihabitans albus TaxID=2795733 RepID=UPI0018F1DE7F|nr:hypothetical protein [Qaidamihabitans albus]